jgi:hypothetical protein
MEGRDSRVDGEGCLSPQSKKKVRGNRVNREGKRLRKTYITKRGAWRTGSCELAGIY